MRNLFIVPNNRTAIRIVAEEGGKIFVTHGSKDFITQFWQMEDFVAKYPQYRSKSNSPIIKTACAYNDKELKTLAKKVIAAMEVDSSLSVNDVIHEQMDMLDEEIAEYQAEIDEDAIDDQELYSFAASQPNR